MDGGVIPTGPQSTRVPSSRSASTSCRHAATATTCPRFAGGVGASPHSETVPSLRTPTRKTPLPGIVPNAIWTSGDRGVGGGLGVTAAVSGGAVGNSDAVPLEDVGRVLAEEAERNLFNVYLGLRGQSESMMQEGRYGEILSVLVRFREPVDRFFEKVMVMAPAPELRQNRLALLFNIVLLFRGVANLSQLQDTPAAGR